MDFNAKYALDQILIVFNHDPELNIDPTAQRSTVGTA